MLEIAGRAALSLLYRPKHVQFPDWLGNHRLYTAVKKREMPRIIPSSYHNVCFSDIDNEVKYIMKRA